MLKIIAFTLLSISLYSQYDHIPVFPDLEGDALFDAVVENYKPDTLLSLTQARDTIYKVIYLENDSVSCIYTDLTKFLPDNVDPSQAMFEDGNDDDINLEHSFPRSKGASSGLGNSDMHHLYPSRVTVNSARGSDPFQDIPDNATDTWYYKTETLNNIPSSNIDLYAEDTNLGFEPPENAKGNIARAQFYFYTMYRQDADNADPTFFELQKDQLCQWHEADPVDSLEWVRTFRIAGYQYDKVNPFVLDCRLARMYCNNISTNCRAVYTTDLEDSPIKIYPTRLGSGEVINIKLSDNLNQDKVKVEVYDLSGFQIIPGYELKNNTNTLIAPSKAGIYAIIVKSKGKIIKTQKIIIL